VLYHGQKYLWSILLVLLHDPLPVVAAFYSENYNFWQNLLLTFAPGLPMIWASVFFVISNSPTFKQELKSELKADIIDLKADIIDLKADVRRLENSINLLTSTMNERLEIQDNKVENAIKELSLHKRENDNNMEKKQ
jgi:hypothetical protein